MGSMTDSEVIEFIEWAFVANDNPFMFFNDRWVQANGNGSWWSSRGLLEMFREYKEKKT